MLSALEPSTQPIQAGNRADKHSVNVSIGCHPRAQALPKGVPEPHALHDRARRRSTLALPRSAP